MHGINPLLVQVLNKSSDQEIPSNPNIEWLPGKYVSLVAEHLKQVPKVYPENFHSLTCGDCGTKGEYDLGLIAFNPETKEAENLSSDGFVKAISMTNYFRCRHCNSAGNWEIPNSLKMEVSKKFLKAEGMETEDPGFHAGPMQMYNGMQVNFVTEAEEQILHAFLQKGEDAFVWDRLGNIYQKGGRADLAAAAFERALQLDDRQMESHQSLGAILAHVGELEPAANHLHQALLSAGSYDRLEPYRQREMLASVLQSLFKITEESNGELSFLPGRQEIERYGYSDEIGSERTLQEIELDMYPGDHESFFPFAEMYMRKRRYKIRTRDRTLDKLINTVPKHKQLKNKRRRKEKARRKRNR